MIGLVAPAAFIAVVVSLVLSIMAPSPLVVPPSDGTNPHVGMCVVDFPPELVDCAGDHDGRITDVVTDPTGCPLGTDSVFFDGDDGTVDCVVTTSR